MRKALSLSLCARARARVCVCVCVCVSSFKKIAHNALLNLLEVTADTELEANYNLHIIKVIPFTKLHILLILYSLLVLCIFQTGMLSLK